MYKSNKSYGSYNVRLLADSSLYLHQPLRFNLRNRLLTSAAFVSAERLDMSNPDSIINHMEDIAPLLNMSLEVDSELMNYARLLSLVHAHRTFELSVDLNLRLQELRYGVLADVVTHGYRSHHCLPEVYIPHYSRDIYFQALGKAFKGDSSSFHAICWNNAE